MTRRILRYCRSQNEHFGGSSEHSLFVYNLFDKYTRAIFKLTYSSQKMLRRYEDERLTGIIKVQFASFLGSQSHRLLI